MTQEAGDGGCLTGKIPNDSGGQRAVTSGVQEKGLFKLEQIRGSQREGKEPEGGQEGSLPRPVSR